MNNTFAKRLKALRENKKLTQRNIASILDISQVSYFRWEQGKTEPNFEMVSKICAFFDVTPNYLLGYDDTHTELSITSPNNNGVIIGEE